MLSVSTREAWCTNKEISILLIFRRLVNALLPLGTSVLKQLEAEETTKSGIVLPGQKKRSHSRLRLLRRPGGRVGRKRS